MGPGGSIKLQYLLHDSFTQVAIVDLPITTTNFVLVILNELQCNGTPMKTLASLVQE